MISEPVPPYPSPPIERPCVSCGMSIANDAGGTCARCGAVVPALVSISALGAVASKSPVPPLLRPAANAEPTYYVFLAISKERVGPISQVALRQWIQERRIGVADSVCEIGRASWVPIGQSPFGVELREVAAAARLEASTCPRCGAGMLAVAKNRGMWLAIFWVGLFTSVGCIGIPLMIIGWSMAYGRRAKLEMTCARCAYTAR